MASSQLAEIQSILDNFKQNMEENAYLEMCNKLKELHEEEGDNVQQTNEQDEMGFYRLHIVVPTFKLLRSKRDICADCCSKIRMTNITKYAIVQMSRKEYVKIKLEIMEEGHYQYHNDPLDDEDLSVVPIETKYNCDLFHIVEEDEPDYEDDQPKIRSTELTITTDETICVIGIEEV